jgi:hypothetical protein
MSVIDKVLLEIEEWRQGKLWGAKRIADFCGVHPDTVARWADDKDCPIKKVGGRLFVTRTAVTAWMTDKNAA